MPDPTFFVITLDYRQVPEDEPGWVAAMDEAPLLHGHGFTPQEAVADLARCLPGDSDPGKLAAQIVQVNERAAEELRAYQAYVADHPNKESP